jgi:hypothetical protein
VRERLIPRHAAVNPAKGVRHRSARSCDRLESQPREDTRAARIPRIGDHEDSRGVQRLETRDLLGRGGHQTIELPISSSARPNRESKFCVR